MSLSLFSFFFFFLVPGLKLDEKSIENGLEGQKFLVVCLFWGGCHHPNSIPSYSMTNLRDFISGTIALSTMTIAMGLSPYIAGFFPRFRAMRLTLRCFLLIAGNILSYFVMSGVDAMVKQDESGVLVFIVVGVSREHVPDSSLLLYR